MIVDELKLLSGEDIEVSPNIIVHHPKLLEIKDIGEQEYFRLVSTMCATPSDYKSVLWDNFNIDYEEVGEFEFFVMLWTSMGDQDVSIIFPNTKTSDFKPVQNEETGLVSLYNENTGAFINEVVYSSMIDYVRGFHGFEKTVDKAGNESTKRYLIRKARKELERRNREEFKPILAPLVSAMVNCEQFKYDHFSVWGLTIYQFMDSVKRIQKIKSSEQLLTGIYSGSVDSKKLSSDSYNWLGSLK